MYDNRPYLKTSTDEVVQDVDTENEYEKLGEFKTHEISAETDEFYDLIIPGIGFLHMSGDNLKIKLTISEKVKYEFIKSFI